MATVHVGGRWATLPQCHTCEKDLKFDYIGQIIDYVGGFRTVGICGKCRKKYIVNKDVGVIEELKGIGND